MTEPAEAPTMTHSPAPAEQERVMQKPGLLPGWPGQRTLALPCMCTPLDHLSREPHATVPWGNVCPAHYLCIKYPISRPKFVLTLGSPPSRLH